MLRLRWRLFVVSVYVCVQHVAGFLWTRWNLFFWRDLSSKCTSYKHARANKLVLQHGQMMILASIIGQICYHCARIHTIAMCKCELDIYIFLRLRYASVNLKPVTPFIPQSVCHLFDLTHLPLGQPQKAQTLGVLCPRFRLAHFLPHSQNSICRTNKHGLLKHWREWGLF